MFLVKVLVIAALGHLVLDEVDIQIIIFSRNPGEYRLHEPESFGLRLKL